MTPHGLLDTARRLLSGTPSETDIRRAVSTVYYAMFHHVCGTFGSIVVRPSDETYTRAWCQAYRYPDHGPARQRCREVARDANFGFPKSVVLYAEQFDLMYERRIRADYDPFAILSWSDAKVWVETVERTVDDFDAAPPEHQRAFVLFICLRPKAR